MNDIFSKSATIWNERLADLMENNVFGKKYTQASLADEMNKRYADERGAMFTQKGVGRWLKVGVFSSTKKGYYGFPEYETMLYIADFFCVDVGYLTGETDYRRFDIGKASSFLGINEKSAEQIMRLTQAESKHPSPFVQVSRIALDHFFSSKDFFELANGLREMYCTSPVSGIENHQKQECIESAMGYAAEVNDSLSLSRFHAYESFFRLLDDLYPYASTNDFLLPDEDEGD